MISIANVIALIKKFGGGGTGGSGLPGGSAPSQYIVTDSNGATGWAERLAWKETGRKTFVDGVTVEFESLDNPVLNPFEVSSFVEGETYSVTWDGKLYECVAYIAEGPETPSIGNGSIGGAGGGGDEPFFVTIFEGAVMLFASEIGTHTISVTGVETTIKKLDEEFMPHNDYARGVYRLKIENGLTTEKEIREALGAYMGSAHVLLSSMKTYRTYRLMDNSFRAATDADGVPYSEKASIIVLEASTGETGMLVLTFNEDEGNPERVVTSHEFSSYQVACYGAAKVGQVLVVESVGGDGRAASYKWVDASELL